uniref:Uncharacterized protein n=1 Tax=Ditylenchus dipsaci TaxID=166011 RepID=A0A915CU81_9BILA
MANVQLTYSQRIGAKNSTDHLPEDRKSCYVWTRTGRVVEKDGIEQSILTALGAFNLQLWNGLMMQPIIVTDAPPKMAKQVAGLNNTSTCIAELASGIKETAASARVRTDARIVQEFSGLSEGDSEKFVMQGLKRGRHRRSLQ